MDPPVAEKLTYHSYPFVTPSWTSAGEPHVIEMTDFDGKVDVVMNVQNLTAWLMRQALDVRMRTAQRR